MVYAPVAQRDNSVAFLIRTTVDPTTLVPAVRAAVRDVEPRATVSAADVMADLLRKSFAEERYRTAPHLDLRCVGLRARLRGDVWCNRPRCGAADA